MFLFYFIVAVNAVRKLETPGREQVLMLFCHTGVPPEEAGDEAKRHKPPIKMPFSMFNTLE